MGALGASMMVDDVLVLVSGVAAEQTPVSCETAGQFKEYGKAMVHGEGGAGHMRTIVRQQHALDCIQNLCQIGMRFRLGILQRRVGHLHKTPA